MSGFHRLRGRKSRRRVHVLVGTSGAGLLWLACDTRTPRQPDTVQTIGAAILDHFADEVTCERCRRVFALPSKREREGAENRTAKRIAEWLRSDAAPRGRPASVYTDVDACAEAIERGEWRE